MTRRDEVGQKGGLVGLGWVGLGGSEEKKTAGKGKRGEKDVSLYLSDGVGGELVGFFRATTEQRPTDQSEGPRHLIRTHPGPFEKAAPDRD